MRRPRRALAAAALAASCSVAALAQPPPPPPMPMPMPMLRTKEEPLPGPEVRQPIAFSHRVHAEAARLACLDCHEGAAKGDSATIPQAPACLVCHASIGTDRPEVAKIAAAGATGAKIPWARVYRLPDFVFFGHREHLAAGAACAECHGPVQARDALRKEVSTGMNACVDCHRRRDAPLHCAACHQLGH